MKLCVLLVVCFLSAFAGVGCGDDGNSAGNNGSNNAGDTGVEDTADNSNDAGDDTGSSSAVIPTANSGAYASTTWQDPDVSGTFYLSIVAISDHQDLCSTTPDSCGAPNPDEDGTVLAMQLLAGQQYATGRYEVGDFDEESFTTDTMVASSQIDSLSGNTDEFDATTGHIDVTEFDAQHVSGTYELTIDGSVRTGSFDVDFCQALADDLAC